MEQKTEYRKHNAFLQKTGNMALETDNVSMGNKKQKADNVNHETQKNRKRETVNMKIENRVKLWKL